jgi:hypothetical protein
MRSMIASKHELLEREKWLNDNIVRQWNIRGRGLEGLGAPVISRIAARAPVPRWKTQARSIRTHYPLLPPLAGQLQPDPQGAAAYADVVSPAAASAAASPQLLSPVLRSSVASGVSAASLAIKSITGARPGSFLGAGGSLASPGSTLPWAEGTPGGLQSSGPTGLSGSLSPGGDTGAAALGPGGLTIPSAPSASPASLASAHTSSASPGLSSAGPTDGSAASAAAGQGATTVRRPSSLGPGGSGPSALPPALVAGSVPVNRSPLGHSSSLARTHSPSQGDVVAGEGGVTPRAGDPASLLADEWWGRLAAGARASASPASAASASAQVSEQQHWRAIHAARTITCHVLHVVVAHLTYRHVLYTNTQPVQPSALSVMAAHPTPPLCSLVSPYRCCWAPPPSRACLPPPQQSLLSAWPPTAAQAWPARAAQSPTTCPCPRVCASPLQRARPPAPPALHPTHTSSHLMPGPACHACPPLSAPSGAHYHHHQMLQAITCT